MQAYSGPAVPVPVTFAQCHAAWVKARRGKRPSANQMAFASRWLDKVYTLHQRLRAGTWVPHRTVSFVVKHPKTREIHAPDFADRVVHHWLVPKLEQLYEPVFIHDSYANRVGKGTHEAVRRLQAFVRQRNGKGWFLQLDVHNFFNSIHRPTLYALLKQCIAKAQLRGLWLPAQAQAVQSLCHKLLAQPVLEHCSNPQAAAKVPAHKRLRHAARGCGLPIGNLTSQFFANVVLNELDQFVKHQLKARHYLRYVDDFVLLASGPDELAVWHAQIEAFLHQQLRLKLKQPCVQAPLQQGIDFLGYRVWHTHKLVRKRVVTHCCAKLQNWQRAHVQILPNGGWHIRAVAADLAALQALLASYWGHFKHAHSVRLRHALRARFSWLSVLFQHDKMGDLHPRWVLQGDTLANQVAWLRQQWPQSQCWVQRGC